MGGGGGIWPRLASVGKVNSMPCGKVKGGERESRTVPRPIPRSRWVGAGRSSGVVVEDVGKDVTGSEGRVQVGRHCSWGY